MTDRHPLAPLTEDELCAAVEVMRAAGAAGPGAKFVWCALDEPAKQDVLAGRPTERRVLAAVYDPPTRRTSLVGVSLDRRELVAVEPVEQGQPQILDAEWIADAIAVKADPGFRAALARRGITDLDTVRIEPWPAGHFGEPIDRTGRRFGRAVAYVVEQPGDNPYARPVENLVAIVDRDSGDVIELHDGDLVPVPRASGRYDAVSTGAHRRLAPLEISQPEGPGFTVDDGLITWGLWRLRVSLHPVEGLVLHDVRVEDGGRLRPVLYRASVSEMVVPYGSPGVNHWWKNAFDAGDSGLGKLAASLRLGCDCLGEIVYLDAPLLGEDGEPRTVEQAVCLHEEDYGVLWRHHDIGTGETEVRRSRRLVVSSFATVGNYDYGFFWYLYLDGTIQAEVKLTGIGLAQATVPGERSPFASPVTPELAAPHHQHLFAFRLDMCVDGADNTVVEVDAVPACPSPTDNPHGNAFTAQRTRLTSEAQAARMAAPERWRSWHVTNTSSLNACDEPVAYRLVPTHPAVLLAHPSAAISRRAAFATRHLWVTAFDPAQRRAAGDFPNQHPGGAGLPEWVAADRDLVDADVVLWHTVGVTHLARPEDFPIMPCDYVGLLLKPAGFFDRNPSLDVLPPTPAHGAPHCVNHEEMTTT